MDAQITATVVFPDWDEELPSIGDKIVREAARLAIQDEKIKAKIESQVLAQIDERVNRLLFDLFEREVQPTDRWGQPKGDTIRIADLLQRDAETWLMTKVDSYGSASRDSYHRDQTRLEYLIKELYKKEFKGYFSNAVKQGIDAVKANIREQIDADIKAYLKGIASTV